MGQEIQTHSIQNNFLSGCLDQRAQGRVDTNAYISSMLTGTNIELVHLGGVQRRRGLVQKFVCPNVLTLLSGTYTQPNGPTSAPALGTNSQVNTYTTTTPPNTTDPYVLVHLDLGSAQNVLFADVLALTLASGSSTQFAIQYSTDNTNWTTLGTALPQLDSTANYTYRRTAGVTFPPTYTNARYWRVAKIGGTALASDVIFSDFVLWGDSGVISAGREVSFEVSTTEQYMLVITDHSGIVTNNGTIVDYVALPYANADLAAMDGQSSAESMMLVHNNYAQQFVVRLSSPLATGIANQGYYNFQTFLATFAENATNTGSGIPQVDYADSLSPVPTSDLQTLAFNNGWVVGDTFTLTILTDTTGPITYAGDNNTTANAIAAAVQALWVVNGFTGVSCTSNGSFSYTLTFADAAANPMGAIAITSLSSNATATATETQVGVSRQENAWSATRGYPSTVTFYQGRMYFGGLRSQQETLVGSWVNDILQFDTAQGLDDQAVYTTMNGVALNAVTALFPGRSLCVFTTGGEFRFVNDNGQPVTPTSFATNQTQYGTANIKPVMIDGNIIFVQRNLNSIRDFQFDYTQDQFNSLGLSSFAGNLVYNVQDLAAWNGSAVEEINLVFVCNGVNSNVNNVVNPNPLPNGTCGVYNTRKEANVQGWTLWQTQGEFQNVASIVQDVYFLVQRNLNGTTALVFEEAVEGTFMDCSTGSVVPTPTATVTSVNSAFSLLHGGSTSYICSNTFSAGQVVNINGVVYTGTFNPNIQGAVITSANSTAFTIAQNLGNGGSFTYVSGGTVTSGSGVAGNSTITGIAWLNGMSCRAIADGFVLDDVIPAGGEVTLTRDGYVYTVQNSFEIGLNFNPTVEPMPLQTVRWPSGSNLARKKRIVKARIKVANTLGLLYNGEVMPTTTIDTINFDSAPVPYSGILALEDASTWDEDVDKIVTFTQVDPLPFYLMYVDVELSGDQ